MKTNSYACFAHAFFIFVHFANVLVLSKTQNDLFCSCVDDMSMCSILSSNLRSAVSNLIQGWLENYCEMIAEVTFSDDVLADVDIVFA